MSDGRNDFVAAFSVVLEMRRPATTLCDFSGEIFCVDILVIWNRRRDEVLPAHDSFIRMIPAGLCNWSRAILVVSCDNSCRFCHGAVRLFMRMAGMSEAQIDQLEEDVETARVEPRIGRAMDFARRISRSNPPPSREEHKALIFAVIARGLGSLDCEREARRLLAADSNDFSDEAVDDILANLASPVLTPAEAGICPTCARRSATNPNPCSGADADFARS